ncbi:MAG: prolyl oligopeptidase family serine peptidase [Pyrinomonadaceae bacterium]|nr:prolyl oligopeptidase family serine peptidase [Pyrinomonadaceae bacterium]
MYGEKLMKNLSAHNLIYYFVLVILVVLGSVSIFGQSTSDDFPVPANMKVEGIPPIKKDEVEKLFFDPSQIRNNLIWDAERNSWSILLTDEKSFIYRVASPMAKPEVIVDNRVPNTVRGNPTNDTFAFTDDKADEDNYELYLWKGKEIKKLSSFSGKDESVESFIWSRDGKSIYYTQVDFDAKTTKLCRHDLVSISCFLTDLKGIWNVLDADQDKVLLKYWKASSNQSLYLYDTKTKKIIPIEEKGNSNKGFFAQGRVFWLSEGSGECGQERCLLSLDIKTRVKKRILLPEGTANLQDVKVSPDGKSFLIQEAKDGIDTLKIAKLKHDRLVDLASSFVHGPFVIWGTRWLSNQEVVYTIENVGKPASVESFDFAKKKHTSWTKERVPPQIENAVHPPEVIKWKSFDSKTISGYVIKPKAEQGKSPVVIYIHGGPQIIDRPTFNTSDIRLAAYLGITTIHTNIRGSSGFGIEYMDADNGAKRGDAVKDIRTLIDWIEKQPELDASRIYIRGESYGGLIALATTLQEPHRIKAVIAEYPLVSVRGYLSQSFIDEFSITEYGDPKNEELMKKLDELSPLNNTERWNKTPLFLTRGKLDQRVPERDVLGLKDQIKETGAEVWFIYANEAGHGVGGRYVTAAMYEFLKKQIGSKK